MMKSITDSNFRSNLKTHLDEVSQNTEIIVIPRNNNEDDAIVVMSISEFNSIKETEHLMSSKENRKRLRKSLEQALNGEIKTVSLKSI